MSTTSSLSAEAIAAVDPSRPARRRPGPARAPARRAVARGVGQPRPAGLAGGPRRRRHGRLGHRRPAGRWPRWATAPRGRSWSRATTGCRRGRRPTRPSCAPATRATPRRRWPPTRPPGPSARGGSSAPPAARWPARRAADGVPVIPLPGGFQPRAAVGYGLVVALEVAALAGCGEPLHTEIDVAAAHAEQLVAGVGPRLARGLAGQDDRPLAARDRPADRRRGADHADRLPLEDPDQRERQRAGVRRRAARARSQRDRRLGGRGRARVASARCSSTTATCTPASGRGSSSRWR